MVKRARVREDDDYQHDVARIVAVLKVRGIECEPATARALWERFSESMCAGWMILPERPDEVFSSLEPYLEVVDDET